MNRHLRFFLIIIAGILLISLGCKNNATGTDGGSEPEPDTDGPVISFVNPSEGGVVSGTVDIAGVAEDASDLQKVEVSIDGGAWESSSPPIDITGHYWAYTIDTLVELTEEAHMVEARATDSGGNLGATSTLNFIVDHEYPDVQITSPSHGDLILGTIDISGTSSATGGITISSVKVDPDGSGQYYAATGTSSWTYSGFNTTGITDGSYIMRAVAEADNFNSSMVSIGVTLDNTDPIITITSHADGQAVSGSITLEGTASDAVGLDKVEIKIDSLPNDLVDGKTSWSYPIDTTDDPKYGGEGQHNVDIIATDTAGNFTQQSISLYFDQTPPTITITLPSPAAGDYLKGSQTIEGTVINMLVTDDMEISFNGGSYGSVGTFDGSAWSHTFDTNAFSDGQLTVSLRATDLISTASDVETITYYADNTAPTGAITSPAVSAQVSGQVMITGKATDGLALAASNGVYIEIVDDDNSATVNEEDDITGSLSNNQWSYLWDTALPAPGYLGGCTITVTLSDEAGNPTVLTRSVEQSNTAPSLTVNVDDPEADGGSIVHGLLAISGTATDTQGTTPGVSKVEIWFDSSLPPYDEADSYDPVVPAGTVDWDYSYNSDGGLPDGPHDIHVKVTDQDGGTSEVTMSITVDNTLPVVTIDYPTDANTGSNFLYSSVDVLGTASDTYLDTVELQIDSETPVTPTGTNSWSYTWDTAAYPLAQNTTQLTATATDLAGNTGQDTVTVDVRPKITDLSVNSELVGQSITINGFNFDTTAGSVDVIFQPGGGPETVTTESADGTTITVTIPNSATSGDVSLTESGISSNSVHLDVWKLNPITVDAGNARKAAQQDLAFSGNDAYQAIYNGGGEKELWFSKNAADAVLLEDGGLLAPASTSIGHNPSIAVYDNGAQDEVYISYVDATNIDLRFIKSTDSGGSFLASVEVVNNAVTNAMTSVAYDPSTPATIGITYQSDTGDMMYVESSNSGASWDVPKIVDSGTNMGLYSSLAFDNTGAPCIVYYDGAGKQVKFAYKTKVGLFFTPDFIESSLFQGEYPSIAIDSVGDGGIHVSYYNGNAGDLKYAYASDKGSSFSINAVDITGITGFHTGITLDGSGNPQISSINYNYSTIRYAYYDGSSWNLLNTPDSVGTASLAGTSIDIGSVDGYSYIGYVDGANAYQVIYRP